jgi:hypothetical protein
VVFSYIWHRIGAVVEKLMWRNLKILAFRLMPSLFLSASEDPIS